MKNCIVNSHLDHKDHVDNEKSTKKLPMITRHMLLDFTSNATQTNNHNMVNSMIIASKNLQALAKAIEIDECRLPSDSPLNPSDRNDQANNVETNNHMETPSPSWIPHHSNHQLKSVFQEN